MAGFGSGLEPTLGSWGVMVSWMRRGNLRNAVRRGLGLGVGVGLGSGYRFYSLGFEGSLGSIWFVIFKDSRLVRVVFTLDLAITVNL